MYLFHPHHYETHPPSGHQSWSATSNSLNMVYLSSLYQLNKHGWIWCIWAHSTQKKTVWFNCSTVSFLQEDLELTPDFMSPHHPLRHDCGPVKKPIRRSQRCPSRPSQPFARGGTRGTWHWHQFHMAPLGWNHVSPNLWPWAWSCQDLTLKHQCKFSWESLHFHSDLDNRQLIIFVFLPVINHP